MPRRNRGTEDDRMERLRTRDAQGDGSAGDEGVDDPATSRSQRDDMSATPSHGDELDMNEDVTAGNRMKSQRSHRTQARANDERYDRAPGFSGQGGQKEGAEEAEGTGYTRDSSTEAEDSSR